VDLRRIPRSIERQPEYRTKQVRYALLVFGAEARTRVWLAIDGDTLYVDRNGNGDLTDTGERIAAEKNDAAEKDTYSFRVGEIRAGNRLHKDLYISVSPLSQLKDRGAAVEDILKKHPDASAYYVSCDVDMPPWRGGGIDGRVHQLAFYLDAEGVLQFADRPEQAPIIHFGGPWHIALFGRYRLTRGRSGDLVLGVGSPGFGPGTTTWINYEGVIPTTKYPVAEITFPAARAGEPPLRQSFELKQRC